MILSNARLRCISEQIGRCPNGVDGMASNDATVCCDPSCDTCSEDACADSGCCPTEIIAAAQLCTFVGVAPCVIAEGVYAFPTFAQSARIFENYDYIDIHNCGKATLSLK